MKLAPKPYPLVIAQLLERCVEVAKDKGVRGRARVYEGEERGERVYVVAIVVPAGETVPARATRG